MIDPFVVRRNLMERYHWELEDLSQRYEQFLAETDSERPLLLVQVALWEEDESELAFRMWQNSLDDLLQQSELANFDLDVVMISNNGGGTTPEIGQNLVSNLKNMCMASYPDTELTIITPQKPQGEYSLGTPWKTELALQYDRIEGKNRFIIVEQPIDYDMEGNPISTNAGKLRALRDASHGFANSIRAGYAPGAILALDAESIFYYKEGTPEGLAKEIPPIKVLYNNLTRRRLKAVGSKDVFKVMDTKTGKPVEKPANSAQQGFMVTNTRTIVIPGGGTMALPPGYVAGMAAVSEITPSAGAEDYLWTQMLRWDAKQEGISFEKIATTDTIVRHLNKAPEDKFDLRKHLNRAINGGFGPSTSQMHRWYKQTRAVNNLFSELELNDGLYKSETFVQYVKLVALYRLRRTLKDRDPRHVLKLFRDMADIPEVIRLISDTEVTDILEGEASWNHKGDEK